MKDTERAYIAGLFDGEGSISICKCFNDSTMLSPSYILYVNICCGNEEVLKQIKAFYNGHIHLQKIRDPLLTQVESKKEVFYLAFSALQSKFFLEDMLPFLKLKVKQAELAIKFQSKKSELRARGRKRLSQETLAERESLYKEMHRLNHNLQVK